MFLDRAASILFESHRHMSREQIQNASRIVVKLGTGILTDSNNRPDTRQLRRIVRQVAALKEMGKEVILVSSGAVGAGMARLGMEKRPSILAELRACAAAGQANLINAYDRMFASSGIATAQILLTHEDLRHQERHLNARDTIVTLLRRGVVPIINENDTVSCKELKFGDNDRLSALVACLVPADALVILTTVDGVIKDFGKSKAKLLKTIAKIDHDIVDMAKGTMSDTATGGMSAKIAAAKIVIRSGIPLVIAGGRKKDNLIKLAEGKEVGTVFLPRESKLKGRKRWIAFFHHPKGTIRVDDGARDALRKNGKSLLAPGVIKVSGRFTSGDVVAICDLEGTEFARGITDWTSKEVKAETGDGAVVHRNNLVIL